MLSFKKFIDKAVAYSKENDKQLYEVLHDLGVPSATSLRFFSGYPKTSTIDKWCKFFECEIKDLVLYVPDTPANIEGFQEIKDFLKKEKDFQPLQDIIKQRGISLYKLSKDVGISASTISRILKKQTAKRETLTVLAKYFDVEIKELYKIKGE